MNLQACTMHKRLLLFCDNCKSFWHLLWSSHHQSTALIIWLGKQMVSSDCGFHHTNTKAKHQIFAHLSQFIDALAESQFGNCIHATMDWILPFVSFLACSTAMFLIIQAHFTDKLGDTCAMFRLSHVIFGSLNKAGICLLWVHHLLPATLSGLKDRSNLVKTLHVQHFFVCVHQCPFKSPQCGSDASGSMATSADLSKKAENFQRKVEQSKSCKVRQVSLDNRIKYGKSNALTEANNTIVTKSHLKNLLCMLTICSWPSHAVSLNLLLLPIICNEAG